MGQVPPWWSELCEKVGQGELVGLGGIQQKAEHTIDEALESCKNDDDRKALLNKLIAYATAEAQKAQAAASQADQVSMQAAAKVAQDTATISNFKSAYAAAQQSTKNDQSSLNAVTVDIAKLEASLSGLQSTYDTAVANEQSANASLAQAQAAFNAAKATYDQDVVARATVTQDEQQLADLQAQITQLQNVTLPQLHQAAAVALGSVQAAQDSLTSAQNDLFYQQVSYISVTTGADINYVTLYQTTTNAYLEPTRAILTDPSSGALTQLASVTSDENMVDSVIGAGGELPTTNQNVLDALQAFPGALSAYNNVVNLQSQDPAAVNAYTQAATTLDGQIAIAQSTLASATTSLSSATDQVTQLSYALLEAQNTVITSLQTYLASTPEVSALQQQLTDALNTIQNDAQTLSDLSPVQDAFFAAQEQQKTDSAIANAAIDSMSVIDATLSQLKALQANRTYTIQTVAAPKPLDQAVLSSTSELADQVKAAYANATSSYNILQTVAQNSTSISDSNLQNYIDQLQGMVATAQSTVDQAAAVTSSDQAAVTAASQNLSNVTRQIITDSVSMFNIQRTIVLASAPQLALNDQLQSDASALVAAANAAKAAYSQLIQSQTDYNSALHSVADLQSQRVSLAINFTNAQPEASQAERDAAAALQSTISTYSGVLTAADTATMNAKNAVQKLATDQDSLATLLGYGAFYVNQMATSVQNLQTGADAGLSAYSTVQTMQNYVDMATAALSSAQTTVITSANNITQANADLVTKRAQAIDLANTIAALLPSVPSQTQLEQDQAAMNATLATYNSAQTLAAQDAAATKAAKQQLDAANNTLTQKLAQETQWLAQVAADKALEQQLLSNYSAAVAAFPADKRNAAVAAANANRLDKIAAAKQKFVDSLKQMTNLMSFYQTGGRALPKGRRAPDTRLFI
jgi:chromosome segregation ATPase